ncbi:hypothetical protein BDV59DRAFT_166689 [Aspergillus ambiguus]|uniref:Zn(II)2Cys6 transcription factor n=1 Tax=Aspergillus ambiguus TaxID=176160 RepID=UPI003CCD11D1
MVFPGRLSTGCYVCRKRKVKCDGAKPACQRCTQYGRQCTGYPDNFVFRDCTPRKVSRNIPSLSLQSRQHTSADQGPLDTPAIVQDAPLRPNLPVCTDWRSVCNFMHEFVLPVHKSPCEGHLAFFPDFYHEKCGNLCLKHAVLSVSYFTMFNKYGNWELQHQARKNYGQALSLLRETLRRDQSVVQDENFAVCLLLSLVFDLSPERGKSSNPHLFGVSRMLFCRGQHQFRSKWTRYLLGWVITNIQVQAIVTSQFEYARLPTAIHTMAMPDNVYRSAIVNSMIAEYLISARDIRRSMVAHGSCIQEQRDSVIKILEKSSRLIREINIWHDSIPKHWKSQYENQPGDYLPQGSPSRRDPWTTCFLAVTNACQIMFYLDVIRWYHESLFLQVASDVVLHFGNIPETVAYLEARIQSLIGIICLAVTATVGLCNDKGQFELLPNAKLANANTLLWPMCVVSHCPFSNAQQVFLCKQGLEAVGSSMGHMLAFSLLHSMELHT